MGAAHRRPWHMSPAVAARAHDRHKLATGSRTPGANVSVGFGCDGRSAGVEAVMGLALLVNAFLVLASVVTLGLFAATIVASFGER